MVTISFSISKDVLDAIAEMAAEEEREHQGRLVSRQDLIREGLYAMVADWEAAKKKAGKK